MAIVIAGSICSVRQEQKAQSVSWVGGSTSCWWGPSLPSPGSGGARLTSSEVLPACIPVLSGRVNLSLL